MFKQLIVTAVIAAALLVTGCSGKGKAGGTKPVTTSAAGSTSGMTTSGMNDDQGFGSASGIQDRSGLDLAQRVVYFEYDSSELTTQGRDIVQKFGQFLASNPSARLRLEGHADERGTREYNIGLAERRAISVQSALVAVGALPSQISVVSYGEERPASPGHDEAAYGLNRRVEIIQL